MPLACFQFIKKIFPSRESKNDKLMSVDGYTVQEGRADGVDGECCDGTLRKVLHLHRGIKSEIIQWDRHFGLNFELFLYVTKNKIFYGNLRSDCKFMSNPAPIF